MRIKPLAIAVSVAASLMASSASAAVMVATWTTTIASVGVPPVFGADENPFVMTFVYDTENAQTVGSTTTLNDGLISARASYDNRSFDVDLSGAVWELSQGTGADGRASASFGLFADLPGMGFINAVFKTTQLDRAPVDMNQAFSASLEGDGSYTVVTPNIGFMFTLESTDGRPGSLVVHEQEAGVVPEPATWALMIGGFGMAGATLRRRRALVAA